LIIWFGVVAPAFSNPAARGQNRGQAPGEVIRVIDDGATGDRWLLVKNAGDPGGPGRMVRVASANARSKEEAGSELARHGAQHAMNAAAGSAVHPVIRAGDRLIVEEHSAVVDARLEAIATGSAVVGAEFEARLKIGGKVVKVMALAPGRAELAPETKAQP
jgi:hypothetical protein